MNGKSLLIPIAAFAVSVTGVSAFSSEVLEKAGLSQDQVAAFEAAKELRAEGDLAAAREVLVEAGIDLHTIESVRAAMHAYRIEHKAAIHEAVDSADFAAFKIAAEDSPLADIIITEADFEKFVDAHKLKVAGDREAAAELFQELGLLPLMDHRGGRGHGALIDFENKPEQAAFWSQLTVKQQAALKEAHTNKDRVAVKTILEDAGIALPQHHERGHRGERGIDS